MLRAIGAVKWPDVVPRMAADYVAVHLSMIVALSISVIYQTAVGNGAEAHALTAGFLHYYTTSFLLLSPIFPLVFLFGGFYTNSRTYTIPQKSLVVLRGVSLAVILFFFSNFLLSGAESVGRSVALPFAAIAGLGLCSVRALKGFFVAYYDVEPKGAPRGLTVSDRILVVGGAGYIGSLLVERLLERGYKVRVFDTLLYGAESLAAVNGHPNFELLAGDCRNIQDVVKAVRGVESIVHLAAIVGDPACEQDAAVALETNYAATRMLIEIAKGYGVRRFVFASSCSVYGASELARPLRRLSRLRRLRRLSRRR